MAPHIFPDARAKAVIGSVLLCFACCTRLAGAAVEEPAEPPAERPAVQSTTPPISGPRDLLRGYGIDDSHFARFIDGHPIDDNETETLLGVLYQVCDFKIPDVRYRIRGFRMMDIERWARPKLDLAALGKEPDAGRGQFFRLTGRVSSVEVLRPLPEVVRRFELPQYYRCEFVLAEQSQPAVVFTRNVPRQWHSGGKIDQRASAFGMFLKFAGEFPNGDGDPQRPVPVFVAPRIAWHPESPLGELGMDVGLLDDVQNKRRITEEDRECFYQMLAAVGRAKPRELLDEAQRKLKRSGDRKYSVVPLFNEPQTQHGRLVALTGTARRVVRVRVGEPDSDVVKRFGINHYYNVWLFTEDSQNNPLVFCVPSLPEGMPEGDGPEYRQQVRLAGFFMKSWAYPIALRGRVPGGEGPGRRSRQVAPLLIGQQPIWYRDEPPASNTVAGVIAGGLFLVALLGIWLALWRYSRGDKQFRDQTIARTLAPDPAVSLQQIAGELDDSSGNSSKDQHDPTQS